MLKIRDRSDSSRLTDATDRILSVVVLTLKRCTFDLRRSILNFSIINGLISPSLLAPKYRIIVFSRPSSPFQLRRFPSAHGRNVSLTNSPRVGDCFRRDP